MQDGKMRFTDAHHAHEIQNTLLGMGYTFEHGAQLPRTGAVGIMWTNYDSRKVIRTAGNQAAYNQYKRIEVTELYQPVNKCTRMQTNIADLTRTTKAVKVAVKIVVSGLNHNLFANRTLKEKENRRLGWLALCQIIKIESPEYSIKAVREIMVQEFPDKFIPNKVVLRDFFSDCNAESKYSKAVIKSLLHPEIAVG
jgi:hypothetical protein